MQPKDSGSSPPDGTPLRQALRDLVMESDTAECLELDQATRYAQEALDPAERVRLRAHVEQCPLCASTTADLATAFRPALALHRGLVGWLGPVAVYLRVLPSNRRRDWQFHVGLCDRCRERTERLQSVFAPPVVAALGAVCAALVLLTIGTPGTRPLTDARIGSGGLHGDTPKGIVEPSNPLGDWPTSVSLLENYLYPTKNQDQIEKYWLRVQADHPESLAPHEALARIYRQRAVAASDPRRKAGWQERAQAEDEHLRELARQAGTATTSPAKGETP